MNSETLKYFFPKLFRRVSALRKVVWPYLNVEKVAMKGYLAFADAVAFKTRLSIMLGIYSPDLFDKISNEEKDVIIESADQALIHEFDLLGSGVVKSDPIDWQADLKCSKRWKKQFYTKITHIPSADIKMPWELSRCQHLLWLGEAFLLTKKERYAQEVIDEINWWIDDNPLMYTVNWKCPMDVAFRAVNWIFALNMISDFKGFDDCFTKKVSSSLWQHGFFIRYNFEKVFPESNNHYTSDLVGLLYIGELFNHTGKGRKWKRIAKKELVAETMSQVLPSGVHYERTVSYHRMMTEMLSYPVYMLLRLGDTIPHDVTERLKSMYSYVANYTKPNGYAPIIGDNDDGRFAPFMKRDFRQHGYLNNPKSIENQIVATGMSPLFCSDKSDSRLYADAGVAILHEGDNYLFANNGGYSKRPKDNQSIIGSHTHNDLLSFELALNGEDIVVDAGTYLYTSSKVERDAFRATAKHNTAIVDGEEQNGFVMPFYLERNVKVGTIRMNGDNTVEGDYTTIKGQMSHVRSYQLIDKQLLLTDTIKKKGNGHQVQLFFHLAEHLEPKIVDNHLLVNNLITVSFNPIPQKMEIASDTLSPSFGILIPSKTIVLTYFFDNLINIHTGLSFNN